MTKAGRMTLYRHQRKGLSKHGAARLGAAALKMCPKVPCRPPPKRVRGMTTVARLPSIPKACQINGLRSMRSLPKFEGGSRV